MLRWVTHHVCFASRSSQTGTAHWYIWVADNPKKRLLNKWASKNDFQKKKFQKLEIHAQDLSCTNLVPRFKFQTFKCYLLLVIVVCPLVEWMTMVLTIDFPCSQMSINKKGLLFSYNYLLLKWIQRVYRCDNLPWNLCPDSQELS